MRAISFNGGIYGITAVFVDAANIFGKRALNKTIKIRTGAQVTHELCCLKDLVKVTKSSNVSVPEIIPPNKLQK